MTTYVDSSALVAAYVPGRFSEAARRALRGSPRTPFSPLHELEISSAFALLLGRGSISPDEYRGIRAHLRDDLDSGRLVRLPLDWSAVFPRACELADTHTVKLLTRSLDVLHVASAHAAACSRFVSADTRQIALAKATGLHVTDITRGVRGSKR